MLQKPLQLSAKATLIKNHAIARSAAWFSFLLKFYQQVLQYPMLYRLLKYKKDLKNIYIHIYLVVVPNISHYDMNDASSFISSLQYRFR